VTGVGGRVRGGRGARGCAEQRLERGQARRAAWALSPPGDSGEGGAAGAGAGAGAGRAGAGRGAGTATGGGVETVRRPWPPAASAGRTG